jgi:hypothetical protein
MRLADANITLNFIDNMSRAAVFVDIEKAFYTTWNTGLLSKLSKLEFSTSLFKLISCFLSYRKFYGSVEGEITPSEMQVRVLEGSVKSQTLCNM